MDKIELQNLRWIKYQRLYFSFYKIYNVKYDTSDWVFQMFKIGWLMEYRYIKFSIIALLTITRFEK